MGQYYKALILAEKTDNKEFIRASLDAGNYQEGMKLIEHSYIENPFVSAVEYLLSPKGMFYKSRIVWAGDYAENEPYSDKNLYTMDTNEMDYIPKLPPSYIEIVNQYSYILNHSKKMYITKKDKVIHPLPLLTAEGNGNGGGDYYGENKNIVGTWARDVISISDTVPEGFTELKCVFMD